MSNGGIDMRKPCTGCQNSRQYSCGKRTIYEPNNYIICKDCEKRGRYEEYKSKKRMYERGCGIENMAEFRQYIARRNFLFVHNRLFHTAAVVNWPYRSIENAIKNQTIYKAKKIKR